VQSSQRARVSAYYLNLHGEERKKEKKQWSKNVSLSHILPSFLIKHKIIDVVPKPFIKKAHTHTNGFSAPPFAAAVTFRFV